MRLFFVLSISRRRVAAANTALVAHVGHRSTVRERTDVTIATLR